ncbi:MAG: DUF4388 domain-containing protein [Kofleriaceae bacterium]|nr:DUF4388 domain-containing protein [Kofleriaceae bacterium]MCL4228118.1 hypothetical protein [Myxococcales bacterium]
MRRPATAPIYVSRNHLEGSFSDVPLDRLLAACHRHLVTGEIRIEVGGVTGEIELRAGAVDRARLGERTGARALEQARSLVDGWYELTQRLPDLTGELGGSSLLEGDVTGVPLIALMRHCEHHALTCTITVVSRFDRAVIDYHAGELRRVELNGFYDDDAIVTVLGWPDARFRVAAPPLDLDIEGWPKVRREPTVPFQLGPRFARGTSPQLPVARAASPAAAEEAQAKAPEEVVVAAEVAPPAVAKAAIARPEIADPAVATTQLATAVATSRPPTGGFAVPSRAQVMSATEARAPAPWVPRARGRRADRDRVELLVSTVLVVALIAAAVVLLLVGF